MNYPVYEPARSFVPSVVQCNGIIISDLPTKRRTLKRGSVPTLNLPMKPEERARHEKRQALAAKRTARVRKYDLMKTISQIQAKKKELKTIGQIQAKKKEPETASDEWETEVNSDGAIDTSEVLSLGEQTPHTDFSLLLSHFSELQQEEPPEAKHRHPKYFLSSQEEELRERWSRVENNSKLIQVNTLEDIRFTLMDLVQSDKELLHFTGLHDTDSLDAIVQYVFEVHARDHCHRVDRKLKHKVIMALTKLKTDLSFGCLAVLFAMSGTSCRKYFYDMLPYLTAACKSPVPWLGKDEIMKKIVNLSKRKNDGDKQKSCAIVVGTGNPVQSQLADCNTSLTGIS